MKHALLILLLLGSLAGQRSSRVTRTAPKPRVLFVGDSHTTIWTQKQDFPSRNWINAARSGQYCVTTADNFINDVTVDHPDIVHILCGTTDLWNSSWQLAWTTSNIERMVDYAKSKGIKVVLATIPPRGSKWNTPETVFELLQINDWIRKYGRDHNIPVADYYSILQSDVPGYYNEKLTTPDDQLHANDEGYRLMTGLAELAIREAQ